MALTAGGGECIGMIGTIGVIGTIGMIGTIGGYWNAE